MTADKLFEQIEYAVLRKTLTGHGDQLVTAKASLQDALAAVATAAVLAERERFEADAERYCWLVKSAVIEFDAPHGRVHHNGKDPASTKQPLDNAIAAAIRQGSESKG